MKYKDRLVSKVGDLLSLLKTQNRKKQPVWYRGQSDKTWTLVPSVARSADSLTAESNLIKRFKQNALPFIERRPLDEWEWLFLLQHYGVPTRLLDWSETPLVALYFACESESHHDQDGAVWCLLPTELNTLANVSLNHATEFPFLGVESMTDGYLPSKIAQEKTTSLNPIAVTAVRDSARMYAQLGTFTIMHREARPIETLGNQEHIWRWVIPRAKKKLILEELASLAINRLSLFPELQSVAQLAKEGSI